MKIKDYIILGLLIVIASFLLFDKCSGGKKESLSTFDTIYVKSKDNFHTIHTVEKPTPYIVEIPGTPGATITIPAIVDSGAVVKDYFTKRFYNDSIKNDSITVYLTEEVFKNELKRTGFKYKWTAPTALIKETKTENKQLLFIGIEPYGNKNQFGLYASALFDTKRAAFGGGYDPLNKIFKASVYYKIKLWNMR